MTTNINLPMPEEMLAQIDEVRDDVPRVVWIRRAIELRIDFRNVSSEAIERLIEDWRRCAALREVEGTTDDVDREISLRTSAREEAPNGS